MPFGMLNPIQNGMSASNAPSDITEEKGDVSGVGASGAAACPGSPSF